MAFLSKQTAPLTPTEIAKGADLNVNSVRREMPSMLKAGLVRKDGEHSYVLVNTIARDPTAAPARPSPPTQPTVPPPRSLLKNDVRRSDAGMTEAVLKIPKVKVDEILFVAYTAPAPMTRTAPLDERETVIYRVLPEDLAAKLRELQSGLDSKISKHLKPIVKGKLYFLKYPIEKRKAALQSLIEEWNQKYAEFADEVFNRQAELEKAVADFYQRHNVSRETPKLTHEYLRERFRVNSLILPFSLRGGIASEIMPEEEWRSIIGDIKERVAEAYRESMNRQLDEFFASLRSHASRLSEGKMVNARSLAKLHRLYNEALEGLSVTQDTRYEATFDIMGKLLNEFQSGHERHKSVKRDKMLAASIVAATLNATKAITRKAQPTLEEFQTILDAERRPTGKKREGLREVIEGLTLPTVS
jgi:hypothetical protein